MKIKEIILVLKSNFEILIEFSLCLWQTCDLRYILFSGDYPQGKWCVLLIVLRMIQMLSQLSDTDQSVMEQSVHRHYPTILNWIAFG